MATHDYVIDNSTGANVRADLNLVLQAILSNNSSSSAPSTTAAYMWWADTTTGILKIRNSANNAWVELLQLDGTLTLEDGSASAPGLAFRDDLNTGIFSSAADNFDIATGGSVRVNVSSTGINVTGTVVDDGATHDGDVTFTGASANIVFDKSDNQLEFADNAKAEFGTGGDLEIYHNGSNSIIDSNTGNLEITSDAFFVNNAANNEVQIKAVANGAVEVYYDNVKRISTNSGSYNGAIIHGAAANVSITMQTETTTRGYFYANNSDQIGLLDAGGDWAIKHTNDVSTEFFVGATERMRIDSSGRLLVGRTSNITVGGDQTDHTFEQLTSNQYAIGVHCDKTYQRGIVVFYTTGQNPADAFRLNVGSTTNFVVLGSGNVQNANNSYGSTSDVSLKENIVDSKSQWNDIKNIKVRNYNFKKSTGHDTKTQIGVVAQELETVCPKLVSTNDDGLKAVNYSVLYMKAIKALQEAMAKIEVLETKVAALEAA